MCSCEAGSVHVGEAGPGWAVLMETPHALLTWGSSGTSSLGVPSHI